MTDSSGPHSRPCTADDVAEMVAIADDLAATGDVPRFKDEFARVRLARDCEWPEPIWVLINEIFYAVEDHYEDSTRREKRGGLDDARFREIVASQVPALRAAHRRLATEEGGLDFATETRTTRDPASATHLLSLVRAFVAGDLEAEDFDRAYRMERERSLETLGPDLRAAVESIRFSLDALARPGRPLRFHDLDEERLRRRVAEAEPRLAAAVLGS